ncbi:MAG: cytochrome c biogenesis protein ResB, partial [Armatimonadetes bacterium]|nr:cytochrome c biogenesis protein ResB [Armatimonadota bacterium]
MNNNNSKDNFWKEFWDFLGSAKLAVFMVVILAIVSALGTLIPQGESHRFYIQKFGEALGHLILKIGFSDLYHQSWFLFLLFLLGINLIVSNIRRYKNLINQARFLKVNLGTLFFQKSKNIKIFKNSLNLEEAQKKLEEILKSLHYKIKKEKDQNGNIFYYAQKGVFKKWGSFYTHLGILIIFLGAIYGNLPGKGFSKYANISEGETFKVPEGNFSLKLKKFTLKFDQKGRPLDFASVVDLLDFNNKLVLSKTIRVNNPLEYQGIKFYQSNYGVDNIQMEITSPKKIKEKI